MIVETKKYKESIKAYKVKEIINHKVIVHMNQHRHKKQYQYSSDPNKHNM
jgi:hypothetical protein